MSSACDPTEDGQGMSSARGLIEDGQGLCFEHVGGEEAEFLYHEIFVRRSYLAHGVQLPLTGSPTVIDVGANIGLFALFCARENPRCRIVAVEPAPAAFAALERNLSHLRHAHCVERALADSALAHGRLTVYADAPGESSRHPRERTMQRARLREAAGSSNSAAAAAGPAAEVVTCAVGTLSALLDERAIRRVDLLKIDCEGDELRVLRGLTAADMRRVHQVVAEVHDVHGRLAATVALLRRHGFTVRTARQHADSTVAGYRMVVPRELRLFFVFARRNPQRRSVRRAAPLLRLRATESTATLRARRPLSQG